MARVPNETASQNLPLWLLDASFDVILSSAQGWMGSGLSIDAPLHQEVFFEIKTPAAEEATCLCTVPLWPDVPPPGRGFEFLNP